MCEIYLREINFKTIFTKIPILPFLLKYFGFKKSETKRSKISPENELLPSACLIHK